MLYGVPVASTDADKIHQVRKIKDKIVEDAKKTVEVLTPERQSLWTALRLSVQAQFHYVMQMVPPSLCEPIAAELDQELWKVLEAATGFTIPRGEEEGGLCLNIPVTGLDKRSFQEWAVRLPIRLYGWGLRSLEEQCGPAYLGCLETALPFMAGLGQVCSELAEC